MNVNQMQNIIFGQKALVQPQAKQNPGNGPKPVFEINLQEPDESPKHEGTEKTEQPSPPPLDERGRSADVRNDSKARRAHGEGKTAPKPAHELKDQQDSPETSEQTEVSAVEPQTQTDENEDPVDPQLLSQTGALAAQMIMPEAQTELTADQAIAPEIEIKISDSTPDEPLVNIPQTTSQATLFVNTVEPVISDIAPEVQQQQALAPVQPLEVAAAPIQDLKQTPEPAPQVAEVKQVSSQPITEPAKPMIREMTAQQPQVARIDKPVDSLPKTAHAVETQVLSKESVIVGESQVNTQKAPPIEINNQKVQNFTNDENQSNKAAPQAEVFKQTQTINNEPQNPSIAQTNISSPDELQSTISISNQGVQAVQTQPQLEVQLPSGNGQTLNPHLRFSGNQNLDSQVTESMRFSVENRHDEMTVTLSPPELGRVQIRILNQAGSITGLLEVARPETRTQIQNALPEVIQNLSEAGISVRRIEVVLSQDNSNPDLTGRSPGWANSQGNPQNSEHQSNNSPRHYGTSNSAHAASYNKSEDNYVSDRSINVLI